MIKIYKIILLLFVSQTIFGQINNTEIQTLENYKNTLKNINKVFLIEYVNKNDYLKKESSFIKYTEIIDDKFDKRNLALKSIKLLSTNKDTIFFCERGINFNENQIALFKIKNIINKTNFENDEIKNIELISSLIKQIEDLPKLEDLTKLEIQKKQLLNLCINYKNVIKFKSYNLLKIRFNKAENDVVINELTKLPLLDENEKIEIEKRKLIEIHKNYELKIEKLKSKLEDYALFGDNPSSLMRDETYDELKKDYTDYPFLVTVIDKSKKNKMAFRLLLLSPTINKENNDIPNVQNINNSSPKNNEESTIIKQDGKEKINELNNQ